MNGYYRPLFQQGDARPDGARAIAGNRLWFTHAEYLRRGRPGRLVAADQVPGDILTAICAPRPPVAGADAGWPLIMGILNVTPDSFSDGGLHDDAGSASRAAANMISCGAQIIDIGGESTRPGAVPVAPAEEIRRTEPVIRLIRASSNVTISIDTRKAAVGAAAVAAGADMVNDVSGFTHDAGLAPLCVRAGCAICVMHSRGEPATMQDDPRYDNVLLDVFDFLAARVRVLTELGIERRNIIVDPGIGFGKTQAHNLTLLKNLSLFQTLGCPVLLGASRKRFIGSIGEAPLAGDRDPGSIAVALAALAQGVQILRVHDVAGTVQAVRLWNAVR